MLTTSTAFDAAQFNDGYPLGIEHNWWCVARNRIIASELAASIPKTARILDIGCGPGMVVRYLRDRGWNAIGCDLGSPHPIGDTGLHLHLDTPADRMPDSIRYEIDCLMLLDVIEHIADAGAFLTGCLTAYPNAKTVLITVPARPEAWSAHDVHYGHFRRYLPETLKAEIESAGLRADHSRYFFHSLYLAAVAINKLGIARWVERGAPKQNMALAHKTVAGWLSVEDALLRHTSLPGLSLLAVARR